MSGWPLFLAVLFVSSSAGDALTCKGADGSPVDWFYIYKLPILSDGYSNLQKQGKGYAYITPSTASNGWTISSVGIDDQNSIIARTLAPMYDRTGSSYLRVLYNDDPPTGRAPADRGHTKGVVLSSEDTGFWLVHSVPNFPPPISKSYSYPANGLKNGQNFLCISVRNRQVDEIGWQLQYNEISAYDWNIPDKMKNRFQYLEKAISGIAPVGGNHRIAEISSMASTVFTSYAKSREFRQDLYSDLVAKEENVPLAVQSWRRNGGKTPSCDTSGQETYNVQLTQLFGNGNTPIAPEFRTSKDHSKWAVSFRDKRGRDPHKKLVCVGDINRTDSQTKRGGGTVCLSNQHIWNSYMRTVRDYERCPVPSPTSLWVRHGSSHNGA